MKINRAMGMCSLFFVHMVKSYYPKYVNLNKFKYFSLYSKKNHMSFVPKTENQQLYLKHLKNPDIKILFSQL